MELSLFIAKILGIMHVTMGFGLVLKKKHYYKMFKKLIKDSDTIFLFGLFSLLIGTIIVLTHQVWGHHWNILITIYGWLALAKGVSILLFPHHISELTKMLMKKDSMILIAGQASIIIGVLFAVAGFGG